MRCDWVTLVKTAMTDTTFQQEMTVSSLSCWAELKSVSRSEYYVADANGRRADAMFELSPVDYDGHQKLVHHAASGDVEYRVLREYRRDSNTVELTCSRMTE